MRRDGVKGEGGCEKRGRDVRGGRVCGEGK